MQTRSFKTAFVGFVIFFGLLFSGCVSAPVGVPLPSIHSPELNGRDYRVSVGAETMPVARVDTARDASSRPPDLSIDDSDLQGTQGVDGLVGMDFLSRFAVQGNMGTVPDSGTYYRVKLMYQPIGSTYADAEPGNFSLLLGIETTYAENTASGNQDGIFGAGGNDWKLTNKAWVNSVSLSAGYRLKSFMMLFAGVGYGSGVVSGKLDQDRSDDGSDPGGHYSVGDKGLYMTDGGFGIDFSTRMHHFIPEIICAQVRYSSTLKTDCGGGFTWRMDIFGGKYKPEEKPAESESD